MLSNKLTFSLVYLVFFAAVLAFIATPAVAQRVIELPDNTSRGFAPATTLTGLQGAGYTVAGPSDSDFLILRSSNGNGILTTSSDPRRPLSELDTNVADAPDAPGDAATDTAANNIVTVGTVDHLFGTGTTALTMGLPDLEDFFARGGTIDVITPILGRYEQSDDRWHEVVLTEIMWGLDWRPSGTQARLLPQTDKQWLELYNSTDPEGAYKDVDGRNKNDHPVRDIKGVRLIFRSNIFFGADASASPAKADRYVGVYYSGDPAVLHYTWLKDRPVWDENAVPGAATGDAAALSGNNGEDTAGSGAFEQEKDKQYFHVVYKVLDRVSNLGRGGRQGPMPGQSGSTAKDIDLATVASTTLGTVVDGTYVPLISAFRKRVLLLDDQTGIGDYSPTEKFSNGSEIGGWMSSWEEENAVRRRNIEDPYIATPGAEHLTPKPPDKSVVPVDLVFNEIRNDTSEDDIDWIELYNNSAAAVELDGKKITQVVAITDGILVKEEVIITLPAKDDDGEKIMLGAGEYLLIVNRDPEDSILADGKDIMLNASNRLKLEGAEHLYYLPEADWTLDGVNKLLVLRTGDPGAAGVLDIVGSEYFTVLRDDVDTKVWPLRSWPKPEIGTADDKAAEIKDFGSQGRHSMTWARKNYRADHWWRNDEWGQVAYMGGIGYRKDLGHGVQLEAPGTPGYPNAIPSNYATYMEEDAAGAITISEIMYDAGAAWDLVQWIELYNNSMTDSVDISDWTMDIRNARDEEEPDRSFVDADFEFDAGTIIAPNQTLLVVSATGATNVPANRVYDLYDRHGNELGLKSRRAYLLSKVGFRIELYDDAITPVQVDAAGNAYLDGASVITGEANPDDANDGGWALHEVSEEGGARHSMVRQYGARFGTKAETSGYESAAPGTMDGAWRKAGLESGNIGIFYGHTDDFSTPAFRRGGPLPVSLSSFRPYRDKATGEVVVRWVTESELNNAGFNILRSEAKSGEFKVINLKGLIQGHGTTSEKHVYTFIDKTAKPNVVYYYQIEDVSMDGQRTTLTTTHLRGNVTAANKLTIRWGELKSSDK